MVRAALTGTRIRERRMVLGMRQADLARAAGISASYLNLIEHNRRRVGPDLLPKLATVLDVETGALSEGAEAALVEGLRAAAAIAGQVEAISGVPELDRIEEFIGRFPGWATRLAALARRHRELELIVERLSDRMTHDPFLSDALHEVLSAVTALRSTAAILAETEDIDPEWRARFHANMHSDALRMSAGAETLVAYLDGSGGRDGAATAPLEELELWRASLGYHLPDLESGQGVDDLIDQAPELASGAARHLARDWAARYRADAAALPLVAFQGAVAELGAAPAPLARRFGVDLAAVMRRLAVMPDTPGTGLVICDGSGTLIFRKALEGFEPPRFGAACPLWPLYQALTRPMQPIHQIVAMAGRLSRRFECFAIAQPRAIPDFDTVPLWEATMLIRPAPDPSAAPDRPAGPDWPVGPGCRICQRAACPARREPSILSGEGQAGTI
jgi:transcriptional regulator with XRE-family HTH domain